MQAISTKLQIQVCEKKNYLFIANFKEIRYKRQYNANKTRNNC